MRTRGINQRGEVVIEFRRTFMSRPPRADEPLFPETRRALARVSFDFSDPSEIDEIRDAVRALCDGFPGEYWRGARARRRTRRSSSRRSPSSGWLAALIPEEYGGGGPRHRRGERRSSRRSTAPAATRPPATRRCTSWARCSGTAARSRSSRYLPRIAVGRAAAAGVRRHRADRRLRHDADPDARRRRTASGYVDQRPEGLDLARRALRPDAPARAHDAARGGERKTTDGLSVFLVDMRDRGERCTIRPIKTMMNHATTEVFFDGVEVPADALDRRGGQGLPLHPRRHERRADPDRGGVHRRRPLVRREGRALRDRSGSSSAGRSARTRACSSRSRGRTPRSRPPT